LQKQTLKAMVRFYSLPQIFNKLNQFNIWAMIVRAYGWRVTRQTRRNMRDFVAHLRELYQNAGDNISTARQGIQLRARKTTDDLKEYFRSINLDRIRQMKQQRLEQWRKSAKGQPTG
ncbi:MAG: hypothetical protein WCI75_20245, partial [candidate division NC10 bacterium]